MYLLLVGVVQFTFYWRAELTQHYWHATNPALPARGYYAPHHIILCITVYIDRGVVLQFTFYWRATNPALLACNQPSLTGTVLAASRALLCPIPYNTTPSVLLKLVILTDESELTVLETSDVTPIRNES